MCRIIALIVAAMLPVSVIAGALDSAALQARLDADARSWGEPVGIAIRDLTTDSTAAIRGATAFPMASTFKAFLAIALLDAADRGQLSLDEKITVRRADLSLFWQPIEQEIGADGYITTLSDLMARAVGESDNAAADILLRRLGGGPAVRKILASKRIRGVRIDRQERDIQTAIAGLQWHDEFVDPAVLSAAMAAVPAARREDAWHAYLNDSRDTATPAAATAALAELAQGRLLSPASTQALLEVMTQTRTGPARLKAGLPPDWQLAHKTGSGQDLNGRTLTTNDIGIVTAPDGHRFTVAVYLPDSAKTTAQREGFIAGVSRALVAAYSISR